MNALVSRSMPLATLDEKKRTCDFVASTDAIDSYDEVVAQDWLLDRFLDNPVILFAHNSRELPVGTATRCEVVTNAAGRAQLECTIKFATKEANPVAENVWQSVVQRTLNAVSVGFMPGDCRFEKRAGRDIYVLSKNELREISVVPIPANPEALAKMHSKAFDSAARVAEYVARPSTASPPDTMIAITKSLVSQMERRSLLELREAVIIGTPERSWLSSRGEARTFLRANDLEALAAKAFGRTVPFGSVLVLNISDAGVTEKVCPAAWFRGVRCA